MHSAIAKKIIGSFLVLKSSSFLQLGGIFSAKKKCASRSVRKRARSLVPLKLPTIHVLWKLPTDGIPETWTSSKVQAIQEVLTLKSVSNCYIISLRNDLDEAILKIKNIFDWGRNIFFMSGDFCWQNDLTKTSLHFLKPFVYKPNKASCSAFWF